VCVKNNVAKKALEKLDIPALRNGIAALFYNSEHT
jgi:hypothetical protein